MNTTKLNNTTQKARRWIDEFNTSSCYSVDCFYNRCSSEKISIEKEIKEKMRNNDCINYRVLSGNCFHFVCGYTSRNGKTLYIETFGNTWEIEL